MKIPDGWKLRDELSGLILEVDDGETMDRLHIEWIDGSMNRDFYRHSMREEP